MFKIIATCIVFLSFNNLFAASVDCKIVGGMPSTFIPTKFSFTTSDNNGANFKFSTTKGELNFSKVECHTETVPDQILSCEHDDFVMILATDEKPLKAVVNPLVYEGKEYGPFFYLCK